MLIIVHTGYADNIEDKKEYKRIFQMYGLRRRLKHEQGNLLVKFDLALSQTKIDKFKEQNLPVVYYKDFEEFMKQYPEYLL